MKILEHLMDRLPGLRRVRAEQARRDRSVVAQQRHADRLGEKAKKVTDRIDRADQLARELRALGQAFRQ